MLSDILEKMDLLRALFPKWSFFDQVGHSIFLEYRGSEDSSWQRVRFETSRKKMGLFVNSEVNFTLAQIHILEQFAQNPENESSLCLVQSLLKEKITNLNKVQFRLVVLMDEHLNIVYQSGWLLVDSL